jgi:uncharacterized protein YndB with AHSA1/START domain
MSKEKVTPSSIPQELTLVRTFSAPRDLVFKAWTDPVHLAKWWGPAGFTTTMKKWEAHPGGAILLEMNAPYGEVYPMGGGFVQVSPPEKLVFKASALDAAGEAIFEVLNSVSFEDEGGKTKLTLQTRVLSKRPDADQYIKGQKEGWTQSLERLEALVTRDGG